MRAAGLISLLLALGLGVAAVENYVDDSKRRDRALDHLSLHADSPLRSSDLEEIAEDDIAERNDEIVGGVAAVLLIGSLAVLSRRFVTDL